MGTADINKNDSEPNGFGGFSVIDKIQVIALCLGIFLIAFSFLPVFMIVYRGLWWRVDTLVAINFVFMYPFIGTAIAVILIFVSFFKD